MAEAGLDIGQPIFAVQNGSHGAESLGKDFKLFELLLTMSTDEQVLLKGGGGRLGYLLQHVFFELILGNVHCGRLKHSHSPFH